MGLFQVNILFMFLHLVITNKKEKIYFSAIFRPFQTEFNWFYAETCHFEWCTPLYGLNRTSVNACIKKLETIDDFHYAETEKKKVLTLLNLKFLLIGTLRDLIWNLSHVVNEKPSKRNIQFNQKTKRMKWAHCPRSDRIEDHKRK